MNTASPRNQRAVWSLEEIAFVEAQYGVLPAAEIGRRLGRSTSSVRSMIHRLGFSNKTSISWSEAEKEIMLTHYAGGADISTVMNMLPGRTQNSIESMACKLNIIRRQWLAKENAILQRYYATEGYQVAKRLPGRTTFAIANQAFALGIKCKRRTRWSPEELALLKKNLHLELSDLVSLLPARSRMAIWHMRTKLQKSHQPNES